MLYRFIHHHWHKANMIDFWEYGGIKYFQYKITCRHNSYWNNLNVRNTFDALQKYFGVSKMDFRCCQVYWRVHCRILKYNTIFKHCVWTEGPTTQKWTFFRGWVPFSRQGSIISLLQNCVVFEKKNEHFR